MGRFKIERLVPPLITFIDNDLDTAGFVDSGNTQFKSTVQDYSNRLFVRSVRYGDAQKGDGLPREITHDNVNAASLAMARSFGKPEKSAWLIVCQIFEYIFTGSAGIGAGNLSETWGIVAFGLSLGLTVILMVVRMVNSKNE